MPYQDDTNLYHVSKFIVDAGGGTPYQTVQSAINAAYAAGGDQTVYIRSGYYLENLTLYRDITLCGCAANYCHIDGTHNTTNLTAGTIEIKNLYLSHASAILSGASAHGSAIFFRDCIFALTNGYVMNLPNWSGALNIISCTSYSVQDGILYNTATAALRILASSIGGGVKVMNVGSALYVENSHLTCRILATQGVVQINSSQLNGIYSQTGTAQAWFTNSFISSGANQCITQESTSPIELDNCVLASINLNAMIGNGIIRLGNISFSDASAYETTLEVVYTRTTNRATPYIVGEYGNYQTITAAITQITNTSEAPVIILIQPGSYNGGFTVPDGTQLVGLSQSKDTLLGAEITTSINAPLTGAIGFENISFWAADAIVTGASSATIILDKCHSQTPGGYLIDAEFFTGLLEADNCDFTRGATNEGVLTTGTTASGTFVFRNCSLGEGTANVMTVNGSATLRIENSILDCPLSLSSTAHLYVTNSEIRRQITTADFVVGVLDTCYLNTGATAPIVQNSADTLTLNHTTINSSAAQVLTGSGNLKFGSITYVDSTAKAGTLTSTYTSRFETGVLKIRDTDTGILEATNGVITATGGLVNEDQIYYVGKHGSDTYNGRSLNHAKLTFGNAITTASAAGPGAANKFSIVCNDAGIYTEDITLVSYVNIFAPNATLTGAITLVDYSGVKFATQNVATATIGVSKTAGTACAMAEICQVICAGSGIGVLATVGDLCYRCNRMTVENGIGVGALVGGPSYIHAEITDIYMTGNATGVASVGAGTSYFDIETIINQGIGNCTAIYNVAGTMNVKCNYVLSTTGINHTAGTVIANIGEINATTAYTSAAGTMYLTCDHITGTETLAGGTVLRDMLDSASWHQGNATFTTATAGTTRNVTVSNTDNTNTASHASSLLSVGGASGGDPYYSFGVQVAAIYDSFGIDNSDSDKIKLNTGSAGPSAGTNLMTITQAGEFTYPLQPAFSAYYNDDASQDDVTGDGTQYTILFPTEIFDQNADFASPTFTAPVTGRYLFTTRITIGEVTAAHTSGYIKMTTSNRTYDGNIINCGAVMDVNAFYTFSGSQVADMDAADTAIIKIVIYNGAKVIDVIGTASCQTNFSGELLC